MPNSYFYKTQTKTDVILKEKRKKTCRVNVVYITFFIESFSFLIIHDRVFSVAYPLQ